MRPYPLPATPHGSRTAVRSDCGYKGVSAPLRIIAHRLLHLFHGMVLIARPERGHGVPAAWLGTEGMYLAALYCHGIISRTFFVKERSRNRSGSTAEARKGRKTRLVGMYLRSAEPWNLLQCYTAALPPGEASYLRPHRGVRCRIHLS